MENADALARNALREIVMSLDPFLRIDAYIIAVSPPARNPGFSPFAATGRRSRGDRLTGARAPITGTTGVSPVARCTYLTVTDQLAAGFLHVAVPWPTPPTTTPLTLIVYFFSFVALPEPSSAYTLNEPLNVPFFGV